MFAMFTFQRRSTQGATTHFLIFPIWNSNTSPGMTTKTAEQTSYTISSSVDVLRAIRQRFLKISQPEEMGGCHKRQKPQAPIRNRQTRKVANAKGLNRDTNLT